MYRLIYPASQLPMLIDPVRTMVSILNREAREKLPRMTFQRRTRQSLRYINCESSFLMALVYT